MPARHVSDTAGLRVVYRLALVQAEQQRVLARMDSVRMDSGRQRQHKAGM